MSGSRMKPVRAIVFVIEPHRVVKRSIADGEETTLHESKSRSLVVHDLRPNGVTAAALEALGWALRPVASVEARSCGCTHEWWSDGSYVGCMCGDQPREERVITALKTLAERLAAYRRLSDLISTWKKMRAGNETMDSTIVDQVLRAASEAKNTDASDRFFV